MKNNNDLLVVFSFGMSLHRWRDMGILEKELIIFIEFLKKGLFKKIIFMTYDCSDSKILREMGLDENMFVVDKKINSNFFHSLIFFKKNNELLKNVSHVYTHQGSGSWSGVVAKYFLKAKLVYRYGHSLWRRHLDRKQYFRLLVSYPLDRILSILSDKNLVPTHRDYDLSFVKKNKTFICPNFIDIEEIEKTHSFGERSRAVYVGRLVYFKNIKNIIIAARKSGLGLDIYGEGPLEKELKELAKDSDINFMGVVNNKYLTSEILPKYKYFFLVSTYEGMPKALLEAMSAGCIPIVGPHVGCKEIVIDEECGLIAKGFESSDIVSAIKRIDSIDGNEMSQKAMQRVVDCYSLKHVMYIYNMAFS